MPPQITPSTPMGATLIVDGGSTPGATFRYWAPYASAVHVLGDFNQWTESAASRLQRGPDDHWVGFIAGAKDGDRYKLKVTGEDGTGWKRDPYARELTSPWPGDCRLREADFPWRATSFVTPQFQNFIIYQLHVGAFYAPDWQSRPDKSAGSFLNVLEKIPYLADLGVTVVQLLPIQEFDGIYGLGYSGTDYYSPEMAFAEPSTSLAPHLTRVNAMLADKGLEPYPAEALVGEMNQLKVLIDLCHAHGLAVILDVVYNHAGGNLDEESIYFFDRQAGRNQQPPLRHKSLFFLDRGHAGGLVFDYGKTGVREYLIHNARFYLDEYRVDGFRYDQVSVIDHDGSPHGWSFCQDMTSTLKYHRPSAMQLAEYWDVNPLVVQPSPHGAGFHSTLANAFRLAIRRVIHSASYPGDHGLDMTGLLASFWPAGFAESWQFVQGPENHDLVFASPFSDDQREERMARLADPRDPRSWYARSRSRVAMALTLTVPGIPMLFMGQEFMEDKQWSDNVHGNPGRLLYWDGLQAPDPTMRDFLRCTRELISLRWRCPALRGNGYRPTSAHDQARVLSFHRWVPGEGHDIIIVASLSNTTHHGYRIGFPGGGRWVEAMNTDVYDQWVNPGVVGNGGQIHADPHPWHDFSHSALVTLPANSVLVFTR